MLNVRHIRDHPVLHERNCIDRDYGALAGYPAAIVRLSAEAAQLQAALKEPRQEVKRVEAAIARLARDSSSGGGDGKKGEAKTRADGAEESSGEATSGETAEQLARLRRRAAELKGASADLAARQAAATQLVQKLALQLPNLADPESPRDDRPRLVRYLNFDQAALPKNAAAALAAAGRSSSSPGSPGSSRSSSPPPSHVEIGTRLGLLDFSSSATSSGWGFYFLTGAGALLEQALVQYALGVARAHGFVPVAPPSMVYSHVADACGFQPRDAATAAAAVNTDGAAVAKTEGNNTKPDRDGDGADIDADGTATAAAAGQTFLISRSARDRARGRPVRALAATAEIPLAAMYANREVAAETLPARFVATSRCYRAEAGARGVDTRGLYRVHEFTKVELFGWADPLGGGGQQREQEGSGGVAQKGEGEKGRKGEKGGRTNPRAAATQLFNQIIAIQTEILTALGLPARLLEMPTADLGASAARKRDYEVLFPSRLVAGQHEMTDAGVGTEAGSRAETGAGTGTGTESAVEAALEPAWGEVTSTSICTNYQSRRLRARIAGRAAVDADTKTKTTTTADAEAAIDAAAADPRFPHTVNGTALAVPRVLAALLENGWDGEHEGGGGVVVVPEVLRAYMGCDVIRAAGTDGPGRG